MRFLRKAHTRAVVLALTIFKERSKRFVPSMRLYTPVCAIALRVLLMLRDCGYVVHSYGMEIIFGAVFGGNCSVCFVTR